MNTLLGRASAPGFDDPIEMLLACHNRIEHKKMAAAWQCLRPLLIDIAKDKSDRLDLATSTHFIDLYAGHIALENGELLPLAIKLLNGGTLQSLGSNMAARRGVTI